MKYAIRPTSKERMTKAVFAKRVMFAAVMGASGSSGATSGYARMPMTMTPRAAAAAILNFIVQGNSTCKVLNI